MRDDPWPPPARYPAGHELEGQPMERGRFCEGCRERFFLQTAVAEAYIVEIEGIGGNFQEAFLALCEITKSYVSFPKLCQKCQRKQLTPEAVSASRSGADGRHAVVRGEGTDMDDPGYRGRYARLRAAQEYLQSSKSEQATSRDPGSTFD